jgi:hypothetical protein
LLSTNCRNTRYVPRISSASCPVGISMHSTNNFNRLLMNSSIVETMLSRSISSSSSSFPLLERLAEQ